MLRDLREASGMTQDALARASGCSKAYLSLVESGRRSLSERRARSIEAALDIHDERLQHALHWRRVPPSIREQVEDGAARQMALARQLKAALHSRSPLKSLREIVEQSSSALSWSGDEHAAHAADVPIAPGSRMSLPFPRRHIPIINRVAAGYPREFTDLDYPRSVADEYLSCPDVSDPDAFAARVVGDSMEPEYHEGDIVVFSPQAAITHAGGNNDRNGPNGGAGFDCFVRLERDAETTFKRVYFERQGKAQMIRLQPLNSAYPPRVVRREEVAGLYAAVYVLRKIRPGA
jgi:SOS-response transcriptional repressor LexA